MANVTTSELLLNFPSLWDILYDSGILFLLWCLIFPPGAACCFLETPNIRMLATVAQSDATKSDVGTMQAFYTAYLKILECK